MSRLIHMFWRHPGGGHFPEVRRKRYITSVGMNQMRLKESLILRVRVLMEPIHYMPIQQELALRNADSFRTNWAQLFGMVVDGCILLKSSVPQRWVGRLTPYGRNTAPALRQMMQDRQYLT